MIQLQSLTKAFADRVLLEDVTWQVGDRDRIGLCGPNGAGKTTLLRMMAGFEEPDEGSVVRPHALSVGYLPQDGLTHKGRTVVDEASQALKPLLDMRAELSHLEERLGVEPNTHVQNDLLHRYSELQDQFRMADGYHLDLKVATVLRGLGFALPAFDASTDHLSGGWQMRLALAKLLLSQPGLLLLDEPTNHLDLDARNWLETYLTSYPHAVVVVSHDRYFLDSVVTRIADLSLRTITDYVCNYSKYLEQREARLDRLREAKRRQDEEIGRIQEFVDRFRYQATKAAQVQSRIKALEKVVRIEVPPERKRIHFQFPAAPKSGRIVLELRQVRKQYGEHVVLGDTNLQIERGDRIALVGPNGAGKSTLMRLLSGESTADAGERILGHQVVLQSFAQDEATRLSPGLTVYETLAADSPDRMIAAVRNILGGFLFSGDDVYKPVRVLSGGERTRLAVARMLLRPSNTMLLDEPTNHLDIDSKEVLLDALADYGGTLVFVSHDRYFVERLATKIIDVGNGRALLYPGTYAEFVWREARQTNDREVHEVQTKRPAPSAAPTPGPDHETRRRDAADRRKHEKAKQSLRDRVADLEGRIAEKENAIRALEATMGAAGFYEHHLTAQPVLDRHQRLMWEVGDLLGQWEMLQAELETTAKLQS